MTGSFVNADTSGEMCVVPVATGIRSVDAASTTADLARAVPIGIRGADAASTQNLVAIATNTGIPLVGLAWHATSVVDRERFMIRLADSA